MLRFALAALLLFPAAAHAGGRITCDDIHGWYQAGADREAVVAYVSSHRRTRKALACAEAGPPSLEDSISMAYLAARPPESFNTVPELFGIGPVTPGGVGAAAAGIAAEAAAQLATCIALLPLTVLAGGGCP